MKRSHPYEKYEKLPLWKVLNQGIQDLQDNGDLEERTARAYIVGYLAKLLADSNLLVEQTNMTMVSPTRSTID